jgi:pimeloyl-ACP methyl ester carboxylesterase
MRRTTPILLAAALAASVVSISAGSSTPAGASHAPIAEVPVTFSVTNSNRTAVPCSSDGKAYTVKGHIVAPAAALDSPSSATLYLHAVTWGEYYWRLKNPAGYDYASQQAENGNVSVTIDRLGYGESGHPDGRGTCFGSEADVAHQIVEQLKGGKYTAEGHDPVSFKKIFIAGASVGGLTSNIEAFTFKDVAGIINFGWGDYEVSPYAFEEYNKARGRCLQGGDAETPGYTPFAKDTQGKFYYNTAEESVRAAVPKSHADPCGQLESIPPAIGTDMMHMGEISVPVLVIFGTGDAIFGPPAAQHTKDRYKGSKSVTLYQPEGASHYPLVEKTHLETVSVVDKFLKDNA